MNIIFFGSDNFAIPSLKTLIASGHKISCVVTQPDRQKGRGLHLEGTAIKTVAGTSDFKIYQPLRINSNEAIEFLKSLNPDLFIVVSYGQILSQELLNIPKIFSINAHASILPKYRGAAPINWAIIRGEKTTGVTIIKMTQEMDAGPVIMQETLDIKKDDTAITLEDNLSRLTAQLLVNSLVLVGSNKYKLIPQDEIKVSFAPKLKKEDGLINWEKSAEDIYNLIRGSLEWPGAFTFYKGRLLKVYKAQVTGLAAGQPARHPGQIIQIFKEGIVVATGEGSLIIEELQIEGKKKMKAEEFIIGHKINLGEIFDKK